MKLFKFLLKKKHTKKRDRSIVEIGQQNLNINKENPDITQRLEHNLFEKINKYKEEDMSSFSKEYFDWENTPTHRERNCYSICSNKDIQFINEEISEQFKYISWFCTENKIKIPTIKSTKLPTKRIGYSKEKEICTFSFTPFTPTGRVKKVNYIVDIETFPGEPEVDFSKISMKELNKYNKIDLSDGYPFGNIEFNKDFEVIRATYHHWENHERTTYTLCKENDLYKMKKLIKQSLKEAELGKPERVLVKDDILINNKNN